MRDPVHAMLNAIERDKGGVAVIWCLPDLGLREAFQRDLGATPEAWLEGWRAGSVPRTSENFRTAYRAMLLEVP